MRPSATSSSNDSRRASREVCRVDERVTAVAVTVRKLHPPVRAMVDHVAVPHRALTPAGRPCGARTSASARTSATGWRTSSPRSTGSRARRRRRGRRGVAGVRDRAGRRPRAARLPQRGRRGRHRPRRPTTLLRLAQRPRGARRTASGAVRWGPRTLDVDVLLVGDEQVDDPDLVVPHPRMTERAFVLVPLADLDPGVGGVDPGRPRRDVRPDPARVAAARVVRHPARGWNEEVTAVCTIDTQRAFALVGPGRAGTTLALALAARGWTPVARRRSRGRLADRCSAPWRGSTCAAHGEVADAGADADLVLVATPDAAIADAAAAVAPGLRAGRAGGAPLGRVHARRARQAAGSRARRRGRLAAPAAVVAVARDRRGPAAGLVVRGRRPRRRRAAGGVARHAPVPGRRRRSGRVPRGRDRRVQPPRRAARPGGHGSPRPPASRRPRCSRSCGRRSTTSRRWAPRAALTGPVARGDVDTVARHLDALPADEQRGVPRAARSEALRPQRSRRCPTLRPRARTVSA